MTDIIIPKEALGAAAHHAAITIYRLVDPDTRAHELTEDELGKVAIAAIAAAINAWPGMFSAIRTEEGGVEWDNEGNAPECLVLPLTEKQSD